MNSPYVYCSGNPIMMIDPDGRDDYTINVATGDIEIIKTEGDCHSYYLKDGNKSAYVGTFQQNSNGLIPLSGNISFVNTSGEQCGMMVKAGEESKSYINPTALASLIGTAAATAYQDITIIQFSNSDGSSPAPSVSHKNGINGDLRYLRTDGQSARTLVGDSYFDIERNEKMAATLYKFGWTDLISERVNGYLIPKTHSATEKGIRSNHKHHLHMQGYRPIINEVYYGGTLPEFTVYGKRK